MSAPRTFELSVHQQYFDAIKKGTKTWEGRVATPRFTNIGVGDILIFSSNEDPSQSVRKLVIRIERKPSFQEMLQGKARLFLPGISDMAAAVRVYESIKSYSKKGGQARHNSIQAGGRATATNKS